MLDVADLEKYNLALGILLKIATLALIIWWVSGEKPPLLVHTKVVDTIHTVEVQRGARRLPLH